MRKLSISILSAILLSNSVYGGGGWVFQKNQGYLKFGQNVIRAESFFGPNGDATSIPTTSLYTTSLYGEYGLTDRLNAIAYVPLFVRATVNEVQFRQSGANQPGQEKSTLIGDVDLGIKYGIIQDGPIVLAASLLLGLPFGNSEITAENILQTGDGEFNQLISLEASHSFYPAPVYASIAVGFNNRTNGFSEEVHLGAEIGYTLKNLTIIMKCKNVSSLYNGDGSASAANGVFANNTEYFSYTPELAYLFNDKIGFTASAGLALSGKRILAAPNYGVGFFMNL
ncbi:MAG: hypothetical protein JXR10_01375 [Cyclobacteriaceae bacterium]